MKTYKYVCNNCGLQLAKWSGKCEGCNSWNSIVEEEIPSSTVHVSFDKIFSHLDKVDLVNIQRIKTEISEFDRVCGGGIVPGSVVLIGGSPGIGKSTLMLQVVSKLAKNNVCAYVTGEEGLGQVKIRADRLKIKGSNFFLANSTNILELISSFEQIKDLGVVILDSIQTMGHPDINAPAGSVTQVRAITHLLVESAKKNNYAILLIGHVTKEGALAGPKILEHMVDTVLYFDEDLQNDYRLLRTTKNRFGPTSEVGVFMMTAEGLEAVKNPSTLFLMNDSKVSGTAVTAGFEGTRVILCEVQTLATKSYLPSPRRVSLGWDNNRLSMIIGVLQSRCKIPLDNKDVYVNFSGGLTLKEPATDLAVAVALMSAIYEKVTPDDSIYIGEVSLSGTVRPVSHMVERIKEAKKLGFKKIFCNSDTKDVVQVKHLLDLKKYFN